MKNDTLKNLTTAKLWAEFKAALSVTAGGIQRLADVWVELQNRGEDLSKFTNPMFSFLPDVASGKLLPELLVQYGSYSSLVAAVSGLVAEDQRKLAKPGACVAVLSHDGTPRQARPADLRVAELKQVFGDGRIRTIAEQRASLAPAPRAPAPRPAAPDTDVLASMSVKQRAHIEAFAKNAGMTPAAFVIDYLIRHQVIPGVAAKRAA